MGPRGGDSSLIPELRINHSHFLLKALDCLQEQPHHFLAVAVSPLVCKAGQSHTVCGGPARCWAAGDPGGGPLTSRFLPQPAVKLPCLLFSETHKAVDPSAPEANELTWSTKATSGSITGF